MHYHLKLALSRMSRALPTPALRFFGICTHFWVCVDAQKLHIVCVCVCVLCARLYVRL